MDLLQLNKFGNLHNGKEIIFCKTEYLRTEFKKIKKLKNEIILISGNSDIGIDVSLTSRMPDNILVWYCQNKLLYHDKLRSIPIGLENTFKNKRQGHGVEWPHAAQKVQMLNKFNYGEGKRLPTNFIYANFNVQTNITHRAPIRDLCILSPFINWDEPSLNYDEFIGSVLDHEAIVCPAGNGIESHRLYEILYCGRIPITIKTGNYPIYTDLYEKLPVVILDSIADLKDGDKLREMIRVAKQKPIKHELLDFKYWQQVITNDSNRIVKKDANIVTKFLDFIY